MTHLLETWGYVAVFVLTVLESACMPIPSEVTLGLAGALASGATIAGTQGDLNLVVIIVVGTVGSLVGSLLAYWVGRTGGRRAVDRFGRYVLMTHEDLDRVERWFNGRGESVVLFGRVLPVVRTFISLPAGMARMRLRTFVVFTTIGVAVWVALLSAIGYVLGDSWESLTKSLGVATYVVAGIIAIGVAAFFFHRVRAVRLAQRRRAVEPAHEDEHGGARPRQPLG